MSDESVGVDILVERCGLTAEVVSSMLLILELEGFIAAVPGGVYCRLKC
jgi:DNA processing protein